MWCGTARGTRGKRAAAQGDKSGNAGATAVCAPCIDTGFKAPLAWEAVGRIHGTGYRGGVKN